MTAPRAGAPKSWVLALLLGALVFAVFWPALTHGFVNLDDWYYVTGNARVRGGLSLSFLGWALRAVEADNWYPLTFVSHALDVELFGLAPWGHHLTNLLLHAANAALLFLALRRMTRDAWRSAFAAAVFAVHPLQVESVAWVAERKNLLSSFFILAAVWGYARWAERPGRGRYAAVLLAFAAAVLSKAVAVVLPCLLLLLDYWPLGRWRRGWRALLAEKWPFFAAAAAAGTAALLHARLAPLAELPLRLRLGNALVSCALYLRKALWPSGLSVHYPYYLDAITLPAVLAALLLLGAVTAAAVRLRSRRPALLAGWLWFLAALAPMSGLVQVGDRAMADHYAYLPLAGLAVMAAWALPAGRATAWAGAALLPVLMAGSGLQLRYWRDSVVLWQRALSVDPRDPVALRYLGLAFHEQGRYADAACEYRRALELDPGFAEAHNNLGAALAAQGDLAGAERHLRRALELAPDYAKARDNLARVQAAGRR
ncbi:MAG: tetratricopeptide repeat protein [Elusimicrobia bacterium]|jgi:tetratricopeptide (TPR) repeat protein|nr:tetratricopeptide repeat protein [Elusimicrobiota bacterium]